tara:strand:+ start:360 stop:566 length:207 start_codon:yes stop_codon:yes gene_type:complete
MKTVRIENSKLERDVHSKAVLNTNRNALELYKMERNRKLAEMNDINNMKEDIKELKEMIQQLMGKQNG